MAIPIDELCYSVFYRRPRLKAHILDEVVDISVGFRDIPGLHGQEVLFRFATQT